MPADPNMRCVCGYRVFREDLRSSVDTVEQWVLFDSGAYGFGSTPFGLYFGSGPSGTWGLFSLEVQHTHKVTVCESCGRVRRDVLLGGVGAFGSYVFGDSLFVLVTDATLISCLRVRFASSVGTVEVSPTVYTGPPVPLAAPAPPTTSPTLPSGAIAAGILRVRLPDVDHDADYVVSLVDVCAGVTTSLATLSLESTMQNHSPYEAELDGIPRSILELNTTAKLTTAQPGSGSIAGIPFDRCEAVLEYDARLGTLPAAQGWTHQGTGSPLNFVLTDGGILNINTTVSSYFEKEITLGSAQAAVHLFSKFRVQASAAGATQGLELLGDLAPGGAGNYEGVRFLEVLGSLSTEKLDSSAQGVIDSRIDGSWTKLLAGTKIGANGFNITDDGPVVPRVSATVWGAGAAGGASPSVRCRFGDVVGSTLTAQLRNVVVSTPGRFMRAFFRSYAAIAAPVLRLYFVSDLDGLNSARILVRYGALNLGATPYAYGALQAASTAYFNTKNVVVEVTLTLPSLPAQAPFWFSVERDWVHTDDKTAATLHLLGATVRSS